MSRIPTATLRSAASLLAVIAAACSTKPADNATTDSTTAVSGSVPAAAAPATADSAAKPAASSAADTGARATPAPPTATTKASPAASGARAATAADSARKSKAPAASPAKSAQARTSAAAMSGVAATHVTSGTTGTAGAASTTSPAPAASAAAGTAARGPVKVNRFMSYDADAKKVTLEVIAAFNSQQGGFNFNGGSNGSQTITVPAGWQVAMHVKNVDAIPHSAIIIADQRPLPNAPDTPGIPRAYTAHVNDGLQAQTGEDDLSFRASKPGNYLIYCGVPGHGPSGMFIKFVVSESATVPSYQM